MAKYVYPAIFTPEKKGGYSISFPDVEGCFTQGKDMADSIEMASDALCLMLYHMEERNEDIPAASNIKAVKCAADEIVKLITCDTLEYHAFYDNNA